MFTNAARTAVLAAAVASANVFVAQAVLAAPAVPAPQSATAGASQDATPVRKTSAWNLPKREVKLAISGYDPVAYFPEGGGKATKGKSQFTAVHGGVTYRFANDANRKRFVANPNRYEAAHGGWCSFAIMSGDLVKVDAKNFIVKDDRLFLFYKGAFANAKNEWKKGDHNANAERADGRWKQRSGESSRQVKAKPAT
ncbi:MAG: YHS domain-containing (seleno)protein [Phycisphaerales bacterium]